MDVIVVARYRMNKEYLHAINQNMPTLSILTHTHTRGKGDRGSKGAERGPRRVGSLVYGFGFPASGYTFGVSHLGFRV